MHVAFGSIEEHFFEVEDKIVKSPATTVQGLRAKLLVAIHANNKPWEERWLILIGMSKRFAVSSSPLAWSPASKCHAKSWRVLRGWSHDRYRDSDVPRAGIATRGAISRLPPPCDLRHSRVAAIV